MRHFLCLTIPTLLLLACNLITSGAGTQESLSDVTPTFLATPQPAKPTVEMVSSPTPVPITEVPPSLPVACTQNDGRLVFSSEINPQGAGMVNFEIFIANSEGSEISPLTNDDRWDGNPAWAPDRCRIAFSKTTDQGSYQDIYIANLDGSNLIRLTNDPFYDREPSWSLDGSRIVFMREHDGNRDIFVMNSDGTAISQLTDHLAQDEDPEWSPTGDEIVFSTRRYGKWEIYRMNSDGSDLTRLTDDKLQDTHPTWSPDGQHIAFLSNRSSYNEVYIIDKAGSDLRQVTFQNGDMPSIDNELNWSQAGDRLAFTCTVPGKDGGGMQAICVVGVDGGNILALVNRDPSHSKEPDW
jgi:TolB protein